MTVELISLGFGLLIVQNKTFEDLNSGTLYTLFHCVHKKQTTFFIQDKFYINTPLRFIRARCFYLSMSQIRTLKLVIKVNRKTYRS